MTSEICGPQQRRQARHALLVFLALSVVAHAAVLVALPPPAHEPEPTRASALEVVILPPTPLPDVLPNFAPRVPLQRKPERMQATARAMPPLERQAAVLAMNEQQPAESAFVAPPSKSPEPQSAALDQKAQMAGMAAMPPSLNAAYLSNPTPRYPLASRRAGEQGTVTLRVLVARDGLPMRVDVEKSSGSGHLDGAALEAVRGWRFVPARRGAEPIESWLLVPVVFRLEGVS